MKTRRPKKPTAIDRFEISVTIDMFAKTKELRMLEAMQKLTMIEDALVSVGAHYEIASHNTNEER